VVEEKLECLEDHTGECSGKIEYRPSLTGTGLNIPRCDFHWQKRLDLEDEINEKYAPNSDVPPSWFHDVGGGMNEYGERWDDEY
jgi:hypothetical protein